MRRLIGIGYRHPLGAWIDTHPPQVRCLEITAEHFFDGGVERLRTLAQHYPIFVHGLGLSLGTPGPLDRDALRRFAHVARLTNALWVSEHVAFTRSEEIDLGHLNPLAPTNDMLDVLVDHANEVAEFCGRQLILENITSHVAMKGDMSETAFLNRLCERAKCGLLLDVTNLYINARNHGFDPRAWLGELDMSRIVQLHIVGYAYHDGRWHDHHSTPIQEDLLELAQYVVAAAPVRAAIIERDDNFPPPAQMEKELERLEAAIGGA